MSKKAWIWCLSTTLVTVVIMLLGEMGKFDSCYSQLDYKTMTYSGHQNESRLAGGSVRVWYGEIMDPCSSGFIRRKRLEHFERELEMTRKLENEQNNATLVKKGMK